MLFPGLHSIFTFTLNFDDSEEPLSWNWVQKVNSFTSLDFTFGQRLNETLVVIAGGKR